MRMSSSATKVSGVTDSVLAMHPGRGGLELQNVVFGDGDAKFEHWTGRFLITEWLRARGGTACDPRVYEGIT